MTKTLNNEENSPSLFYCSSPNILTLKSFVDDSPKLIFHLNGDVTWNDRLIVGDEEFKEAVIHFSNWIKKNHNQ